MYGSAQFEYYYPKKNVDAHESGHPLYKQRNSGLGPLSQGMTIWASAR